MGAGRESRGVDPARPGSTVEADRRARWWTRSSRCAPSSPPRASTGSSCAAWAARRSRPRSSPGRRASRWSSSTAPTPARSGRRSSTSSAPSSWSRASPARPSRPTASGARSRRRSRPRASTPSAGSSSSPTRARPLEQASLAAGYRAVFRADPTSAAGSPRSPRSAWCPSGLAGVDIGALLDQARRGRATCSPRTPTATRRSSWGRARWHDSRCATRSSSSTRAPASSASPDWAEQLIAESTGKDGHRPAARRRRAARRRPR